MQNDLLTNKTNAALLRESELEIVRAKIQPVNLVTFHPDDWNKFLAHNVVLPLNLANAISGHGPFSKEDVHAIEKAVEEYHGVKPPFYIYMSLTLQQTGRPWAYVKEAGRYLTGLTLGKIDNRKSTIENA